MPSRKGQALSVHWKKDIAGKEQDSEITAIIPTVIRDPYIASENGTKVNIFITLPISLQAQKMRVIFTCLPSGGKIIQLEKRI